MVRQLCAARNAAAGLMTRLCNNSGSVHRAGRYSKIQRNLAIVKSIAIAALMLAPAGLLFATGPYPDPTPSPLKGLDYEEAFFPDADHDPDVVTPETLLGFPMARRAATPEQIVSAITSWSEASDRIHKVHYADSHEGRPLHYLVISSPENLERMDEIRDGMALLADGRDTDSATREELFDSLPGVAWMGYSIHGNESSGADAALAMTWHLAADRSDETAELLDELVVIIDPDMNPDGRARFVHAIGQARSTQPDVDDQSLVHTGYWPYGRGNHYLFDLNRDWIYAIHPETRGRIRHITDWNPLLFVDAHEMGAQDTYLFSPAREPHNPHFPPYRYEWGEVFADDMAAAFDRHGYPYYSGEWHEDWYPGYTDAWASLRGAQGILYEQARLAEDGVQRRSGLISYEQSVHHQVLATQANLDTLRDRRREMLEAFAEDRARVASGDSPYADRSFVIEPGDNPGRMDVLLDLLEIQGFEVYEAEDDLTLSRATDQLGIEHEDLEVPRGSLVLPNRQPEGRLLAAMFDFDPRLSDQALEAERERLLRDGSSTLYDTTAWNISMMYGLTAYTVPEHLESGLARVEWDSDTSPEDFQWPEEAIAVAASGADDRAPALAGRLSERGVAVRVNDRDSALNGHELPRGSVVITRDDNRDREDWREIVMDAAMELGIDLKAVQTGRAAGDLPDLGGRHFALLERPRIALLSRGRNNMLDFGATWYVLDHRLGLRHSHLDESRAEGMDLRRYNVLVLPERWGGDIPEGLASRLEDWVREGGTLIASGASARSLAADEEGFVSTRLLPDALEDLSDYQTRIHRDWMAGQGTMPDEDDIWAGTAPTELEYPWAGDEALNDPETLKRQDAWQEKFMPSGALVAARVDNQHWLTGGSEDLLPVLFARSPVFMADAPVQAPLRVGVYRDAENGGGMAGWAPVPDGQELRVRMSGLVWPEAAQRIASSAWTTRESVGQGQVILFAHPPAFRAAQLGAIRVLENALVYGPGLGTSPQVVLP